MKTAGKTFSCPLLFIYPLFQKKTVPLGENAYKRNYFLMANKVWEILIPQTCIDFHDWENRTCTRKVLLNVFQTSKINKLYIKQNLQIHWIQSN